MAITDSHGLPVAVHIESASRHEAKLVEGTLDHSFVRRNPRRLVGDKAYDDDSLDRRLRKRRIRMISPHRINRVRPPTQDGRELRRYKRRWKVERLFAWLQNFRRIQTRWEFRAQNFTGLVKLACIIILLRNYF
jgi:transposase